MKLDYGALRKQFIKVVEDEPFFSEAFERVLKIEKFEDYREGRKRAVEALNSHAVELQKIVKAAASLQDGAEKLKRLAEVYDKTLEVLKEYGSFDRSLTLPNNISDRYAKKLKVQVKRAVTEKVRRGRIKPSEAGAEELELLTDLMSPSNFFSLESTKMIDYLEAFKKIRSLRRWPLDRSVLEDVTAREIVESLARYKADSIEETFEDFGNYSQFIGKEDEIIDGLKEQKNRLAERRAYAEEYVLSELDGAGKTGFVDTLRALDELRRYEGFEDPQRHTFGGGSLLAYVTFLTLFSGALEEVSGKPRSVVDVVKVREIKSELKGLI